MRIRPADVLAIALGLPLLAGAYPPMGDLPLHEDVAALLVHRADPTFAPPGLYALALGHPQQLFHLVLAALMLVLPTAWAAKSASALVVSLGALGIGRALDRAGATRWAALACAPVLLGWLLHWGFVTDLLGLAVFAWALPALDDVAEAPSVRSAAIATGWLALLVAAHAAIAGAAGLCLVTLTLSRPRTRRTLLALAPAAVPLVLLGADHLRGSSSALGKVLASRVIWHDLGAKARQLPAFVVGRYDETTKYVLFAAALATLAGLALGGRRANRFLAAAAVLALSYVVLPYSVNYGAFLYARFVAPAWICLVIGLAPARATSSSRLVALAAAALAILALVPELRRADRIARQLAPIFAHVERGSAVAVLHYGATPRAAFSPTALGARVLAERGGRLLGSFVDYPVSPVVIAEPYRWDETLLRVNGDPRELRPAFDLDSFRYLLLEVEDEPVARSLFVALAPDARLVARSGDFLLFESTHAVRPPASPPLPLPEPPPPTIRERVYDVAKRP